MKTSLTFSQGKGFTLVELLAVVAIIAVLASVIISAVGNSTQAAEMASVRRQLQTLNSAWQQYKAAGGTTPPGNDGEVLEPLLDALTSDAVIPATGIRGPFLMSRPPETMSIRGVRYNLGVRGGRLHFAYMAAVWTEANSAGLPQMIYSYGVQDW